MTSDLIHASTIPLKSLRSIHAHAERSLEAIHAKRRKVVDLAGPEGERLRTAHMHYTRTRNIAARTIEELETLRKKRAKSRPVAELLKRLRSSDHYGQDQDDHCTGASPR